MRIRNQALSNDVFISTRRPPETNCASQTQNPIPDDTVRFTFLSHHDTVVYRRNKVSTTATHLATVPTPSSSPSFSLLQYSSHSVSIWPIDPAIVTNTIVRRNLEKRVHTTLCCIRGFIRQSPVHRIMFGCAGPVHLLTFLCRCQHGLHTRISLALVLIQSLKQ